MKYLLHTHCEICRKNTIITTFIFVGIVFLMLSGCVTTKQKPEIHAPSIVKETKGAKPSEVLAALLAEKQDNTASLQKTKAPAPAKKIAKNTPQKKSMALAKSTPKQPVANVKPALLSKKKQKKPEKNKSEQKSAQAPTKTPEKKLLNKPAEAPQTIELVKMPNDATPEILPETLNALMQKMPNGKMVFAKPQTPPAPMGQPVPLPVASTPVPLDNKTADPIDNMAAEIMHATPTMQQPEAILPSVAIAPVDAPKNNKSRGVFIPIHKGTQINLKPAAIDKLVASNTAVITESTAPVANGTLLSRVKNRAFNHGVILEDKPVLVPAKQVSNF
jgi:hypothetical protein